MQLEWIQILFPYNFVMWHVCNDYVCNTINFRNVNPDIYVKIAFSATFTKDSHICVMFHGTDRDRILKTYRNWIYHNQHATHSLESALHFSQQKECKKDKSEVLVMFIFSSNIKDLENKYLQISYPHHSIPLFVISYHKVHN